MPDGLYERDALAWAEQQAGLLRRVAAGERLNEAVDWNNLIEELQDLGLSELRACRSLLRQAMVHLLKLHVWPGSPSADHWRVEAAGFLADARDRYAPSMQQRIDLDEVFRDAVHAVLSTPAHWPQSPDAPPAVVPDCPFTLAELLSTRPDIADLVTRLPG